MQRRQVVVSLVGTLAIAAALLGLLFKFRHEIRQMKLTAEASAAPKKSSRAAAVPSGRPIARPETVEAAVKVYDSGLGQDWQDWGWGAHDLRNGAPAKVKLGGYGGIIFRHDLFSERFGALVFRMKAPASYGQSFLSVALKYRKDDDSELPVIKLDPSYFRPLAEGWSEAYVPMSILNPDDYPFDRIILHAETKVGDDWVLFDKVVLSKPTAADTPPPPIRSAKLSIRCDREAIRINPMIYGVAADARPLGTKANRIGGNAMTRLNWELGNVWNTGSDWFFENVEGSDTKLVDWIDGARKNGVKLALLVPTIGWVAKDASSVGFPISKFASQKNQDSGRGAGDGVRPDGSLIQPGPPTQTSRPAPPELIRSWIAALRERDRAQGARGVAMYILDNEPSLWHKTHRDVHPEPLTYDELLDRTIRYGTAIREADADAVIAGPAEWGFPPFFYSAKDLEAGVSRRPDRRAHGDEPLLSWYLRKLAEHEKKTGVRVLDVVDMHFYPQGDGMYPDARVDPEANARRLRSTRGLWDPTYVDESWIKDTVRLIPRLKAEIARNYPGRGISIGEWNFGAETHINGALAISEVLGRFGQHGINSAFYWTAPAPGSPGFHAFRAYLNYDGKGARFLDYSLPTTETPTASLFASRDAASSRIVAIVLNLDPKSALRATLDLSSCGAATEGRVFSLSGAKPGLVQEPSRPSAAAQTLQELLPPYSLRLVEIALAPSKH